VERGRGHSRGALAGLYLDMCEKATRVPSYATADGAGLPAYTGPNSQSAPVSLCTPNGIES